MSRGTGTNEAFIVTTGEETALDVFTRCIATDWIDQPALARQAELNDTKHHRPGLLDGGDLRALLEQRHDITAAIEKAQSAVERIPSDRRGTEQTKQEAEQDIARHVASVRVAQGVLDRYDRRLQRRKHETEIADAKREIDHAPRSIAVARDKLHDAEQRIEQLDQTENKAVVLLNWPHVVKANRASVRDTTGG
jgi:hypothetical protein